MTFDQMSKQYDNYEAMARDLFTMWQLQCAFSDLQMALRRASEAELAVYHGWITKKAPTGEAA